MCLIYIFDTLYCEADTTKQCQVLKCTYKRQTNKDEQFC